MNGAQASNGKTRRVVYAIIDRGEGKTFWVRVGTAFENRDGSENVYLDALPIGGRLQIREYQDDDREGAQSGASGGQGAAQRRSNVARGA